MQNPVSLSIVAALTTLVGCSKSEVAPMDTAALFAGRQHVTIAYDANLWGELIECG